MIDLKDIVNLSEKINNRYEKDLKTFMSQIVDNGTYGQLKPDEIFEECYMKGVEAGLVIGAECCKEAVDEAFDEFKDSVSVSNYDLQTTLLDEYKCIHFPEDQPIPRTIKLHAGVRYWGDCELIGKDKIDDEDIFTKELKPTIPCVEKNAQGDWFWAPEIDIDKGRILNWENGIELITNFKVCDECAFDYYEGSNKRLAYENYVPNFLSINGNGYGDYIMISIDKNGFIKNWNTEMCLKFIYDIISGSKK